MLAFFSFMEAGDQFIASKKLYGGSITQFGKTFKKFGWEVIFVDPDDPRNFARALTPKCKAIEMDCSSNPARLVRSRNLAVASLPGRGAPSQTSIAIKR